MHILYTLEVYFVLVVEQRMITIVYDRLVLVDVVKVVVVVVCLS